MEIKDIEKLARLARIELTEEEKEKYLKDISAILAYVDQIKEVVKGDLIAPRASSVPSLRNVMRADEGENKSGENTKDIVAEFPEKEGNYLKVKKIL